MILRDASDYGDGRRTPWTTLAVIPACPTTAAIPVPLGAARCSVNLRAVQKLRHRPKRRARAGRWWLWARRAGQLLFYGVMAILAAVGLYLGVAGIADSNEPVIWGTFTEHRCEETRYGCRSVGTWRSDDRSIRLENVYLDGQPRDNGTIRASYQPTGVSNDADNNIVHTAVGHALGPIMPWALTVLCLGAAAFQWWQWRGTWR